MIRFEHLCAGYDGVEMLHDIGLCVPEDKFTALIGPNGCGKSTLIKAAAGILKPLSGTITLNGADIYTMPPKALAKVLSYMPQSRPVPEMTVGQLVAHGRYPHLKWGRSLQAEDKRIIRSAMEMTDTLPFASKRLDRLSGGERQRAYLAMMLAQQAPVMLLDEPATYLDLKAQFDMLALIRRLAAGGSTVLAVMHDITHALEYADHILLMDSGRITFSGAPDRLLVSGMLESAFGIRIERSAYPHAVPIAHPGNA